MVIAWDEGSGSGNTASTVDAIVMSPYVSAGSRSAVALTHYSLLKAEEDVAGVPELQLAATASRYAHGVRLLTARPAAQVPVSLVTTGPRASQQSASMDQ